MRSSPHTKSPDSLPTRRLVLRRLGVALVAAPVVPMLARCGDAGGTDAGADAATNDVGGDAGAVAWATGGTAAMTAKASYPNPFAAAAAACALTCELVLGPCYSAQSEDRQDISYGYLGLPMRMMFQVVDTACRPIAGAVVDVWHVSAAGKYSGNDPVNENVAFCTGNDSEFISHLYFRGKQTSDANGVVSFDSCFPGWYAGRTIHVHLTVRVGGEAFVTTQLFFDDALADQIVGTQPLYDTRGARDTTNQNDSVISTAAVGDYLFSTEKMPDGALLAWKTLVLRTSTSESACQAPGGGTGGSPPPGAAPGSGTPPTGALG